MTKATSPSAATSFDVAALPPESVSGGVNLSSLGTLFWLTVRQQTRGLRLLVFAGLFSLPALVAVASHVFAWKVTSATLENALVFRLIANALVPLLALLFAGGMIQDEIEDQTLTYLLIRPLPKWAIYVTKLLATVLMTFLLASAFTVLTYLAIYVGSADLAGKIFPTRIVQTAGLLALAIWSYCSLFGCLSLFIRRSLMVGVIYIVLFEGLLANIDFMTRRFTVMYYIRVLRGRWLNLGVADTGLNLKDAPEGGTCVAILVVVSLLVTGLATLAFASREFRMKTPEGS
jgi:ABC-2 type transport system permease protein